jgi:hypothetical protein
MQDLLHATGFDLPGRYVADPPQLGTMNMQVDRGLATGSIEGVSAVTARWHDLRLEAWRATQEGGEIDKAFTTPFAAAPMTVQSDGLVGAVRVDRTRDVSQWVLVVTGVAADGGRDLIATLGGIELDVHRLRLGLADRTVGTAGSLPCGSAHRSMRRWRFPTPATP